MLVIDSSSFRERESVCWLKDRELFWILNSCCSLLDTALSLEFLWITTLFSLPIAVVFDLLLFLTKMRLLGMSLLLVP